VRTVPAGNSLGQRSERQILGVRNLSDAILYGTSPISSPLHQDRNYVTDSASNLCARIRSRVASIQNDNPPGSFVRDRNPLHRTVNPVKFVVELNFLARNPQWLHQQHALVVCGGDSAADDRNQNGAGSSKAWCSNNTRRP
jgi:hypothetical protein